VLWCVFKQPYLVEQEGVEGPSQRLHQRHDLARGGEADPAVHRHRPCEEWCAGVGVGVGR